MPIHPNPSLAGSSNTDNSDTPNTKRRRRLFSRRELYYNGTRVVRVGSINLLQTNKSPYSFASIAEKDENSSSASQKQQQGALSQEHCSRESIYNYSERSGSLRPEDIGDGSTGDNGQSLIQGETRLKSGNDNESGSSSGKYPTVTLRKVTHASKKVACQLQVAASKQSQHVYPCKLAWSPVDSISPPSSPCKLPPQLDVDKVILSFEPTPPLSLKCSRAKPGVNLVMQAAKFAPIVTPVRDQGAQLKPVHLTPLRLVGERLKLAKLVKKNAPPVFNIGNATVSGTYRGQKKPRRLKLTYK
ncbi:hypothetical protein BX661DRAFT_184588 [Kickxella alabastrina]|uniref:uncharacterized protein n=1 Tax=Kickxella alabastrina TaxID=61397 RepID=UPI00221FF779|nr:uncharacterized protein BX661DRAFT_184588 [Kickxella alabastrina]KAI7825448.1 hypothetical protein BX661DRAFT_184588 [Kickxella alabastrina]